MLKFRNALGAKSPTVKSNFLKSGTKPGIQCNIIIQQTSLQTYGKKIVGILVYVLYKKSAVHKFSTVRGMPIIADAMKQHQVWNENLLNISYQSAVFK